MKDDLPAGGQSADNKAASSRRNNAPSPGNGVRPTWQKAKPRSTRERGPKFLAEAYGLSENPFGVTPDPRYLYESDTHLEAKSSLVVGIECAVGFQALIAPPGMGKTTLLCNILEQFDDIARTAFLFQTQGNSRDFLRYLISELGGEAPDSDIVRMQETINQLLIRERRAGRQTIVIIDEAQNLAAPVLETLRLLSNFETSTEKLLHIILAGQPELAQKLSSPEAAQLSQRICIVTTLAPFSLEDTGRYIEHRLKVAGYQGPPLFSPEAAAGIWKRSGGIPREINKVCFNSLLLARAAKKKRVDSTIFREVAADLDLDRIQSTPPLRFNGLLRAATATQEQPANEIAQSLADRIDKLIDVPLSSAIGRIEVRGDHNDMTGRVMEGSRETDLSLTVDAAPNSSASAVPADSSYQRDEAPSVVNKSALSSPPTKAADYGAGKSMESGGEAQRGLFESDVEAEGGAADAIEDLDGESEADFEEEGDESQDDGYEESPEDLEIENESADAALIEPADLREVPWTTAWLSQQWRIHRSTVYLGLSGLALVLALLWAPHSSPTTESQVSEASPTASQRSATDAAVAAPFPPPDYHPKARVWMDTRTQSYYCPGSPMYGTTQGGAFTTQKNAHGKNFKPANREFCQ